MMAAYHPAALTSALRRAADRIRAHPDATAVRPIGAALREQNGEYQLQCRYMQLEGMTVLAAPQSEEAFSRLKAMLRKIGERTVPWNAPTTSARANMIQTDRKTP
jgi:hypothetical protein